METVLLEALKEFKNGRASEADAELFAQKIAAEKRLDMQKFGYYCALIEEGSKKEFLPGGKEKWTPPQKSFVFGLAKEEELGLPMTRRFAAAAEILDKKYESLKFMYYEKLSGEAKKKGGLTVIREKAEALAAPQTVASTLESFEGLLKNGLESAKTLIAGLFAARARDAELIEELRAHAERADEEKQSAQSDLVRERESAQKARRQNKKLREEVIKLQRDSYQLNSLVAYMKDVCSDKINPAEAQTRRAGAKVVLNRGEVVRVEH